MLKHKRTLAGILAATMMLSMAACGGGGSQKDGDVAEGPQDPNAAAAAGTLELTDWEQSSGIFNTDETDVVQRLAEITDERAAEKNSFHHFASWPAPTAT